MRQFASKGSIAVPQEFRGGPAELCSALDYFALQGRKIKSAGGSQLTRRGARMRRSFSFHLFMAGSACTLRRRDEVKFVQIFKASCFERMLGPRMAGQDRG